MIAISRIVSGLTVAAVLCGALATPGLAQDGAPAKQLFGSVALPAEGMSTSIGSYAKGCQAGAIAMPEDGPTWQAMRLSRNRRWGQPQLIALLQRFSMDAARLGWGSGILIGDISQPRGGPMLSGHASHQVGLDADIWFTPMPERHMTAAEREKLPFTSMLDKSKFLTVDQRRWTFTHAKLVMQAASYPDVERIFVNPAIKKKLCDTWTGNRSLLGKVRPIYGHDEHFHIRMRCPAGDANCRPQTAVPAGDGCDKSLAWWFTPEPWAKPKRDPSEKPVKPRQVMLSDLPKACAAVLNAPEDRTISEVVSGNARMAPRKSAVLPEGGAAAITNAPPADVPLPRARPAN
ncbi:penicillin-insensitive murein endopeptidase [Neorhizobium sp. NPDC001467]|uniref:penicillin-insensitive murein endopeptidase n=1 Tax=Neorhizobium sp. NPDC001467 TaxID=3390595 RepID=UPI003D019E53